MSHQSKKPGLANYNFETQALIFLSNRFKIRDKVSDRLFLLVSRVVRGPLSVFSLSMTDLSHGMFHESTEWCNLRNRMRE